MEEEKAVDPRNSSEVSSTDTPRAPEHRRSAGHGKNVSTRIFSKQCKKLRSLLVALSSSLLRIRRDTGVPPMWRGLLVSDHLHIYMDRQTSFQC